MGLAQVYSRASLGVAAPEVVTEVHTGGGLPTVSIVGLPETAVREARDRVKAALANAGFGFPQGRVTISLTPADLPKHGSRFDLPIALGILAAHGQVPAKGLEGCEFVGELSLSGTLNPSRGILPAAVASQQAQRRLVLPSANAREAALCRAEQHRHAPHLMDVVGWLCGERKLDPLPEIESPSASRQPDLAEVIGQQQAKRALEITAAGGHHLLFSGCPGTGKTMLASRLPGILPPLDELQALEVAAIASIGAGGFDARNWRLRPFRAPHHTASAIALVGGGAMPRPGEISLAHHGVLFLDELPEFNRSVLEVLREPLESGEICVSRARRQETFPARFQLLAAMNPCPCGHRGDPRGLCHCSPDQVKRYIGRISGPLLERIDLHVTLSRPTGFLDPCREQAECSADVAARVARARQLQHLRQGRLNAQLAGDELTTHCRLAPADLKFLQTAADRLVLSPRSIHRILRVARTIADLSEQEVMKHDHLAEAVGYRQISIV